MARRTRAPHTLPKERQEALKKSDELRAKNPNKMGPDAPKKKAPATKKQEQEND